jgi:hypothetical protein
MAKAKADTPESILKPDVAAVYDVPEGRLPQFVCAEFGEVDLTAIGLEFAGRLAEKGFLIKK